jgi:DNA repair protein RadD
MKYSLRDYQKDAVRAMIDDISSDRKSVVSLPTGSGKSVVIADFVNWLGTPTLILQPSREILAQNKEKLSTYVDKSEIGVYSASFNLKQIKKYTFATIQSVYKKSELFKHFSVVIIDEAHLYKTGGMFDKFLKTVDKVKVYGLTATPFKLVQKKKYIWTTRTMIVNGVLQMLTQIGFDEIIYTISTKQLTEKGFLCPMEYETHETIEANFSLNSDKRIVSEFDLMLSLSGLDNLTTVLGQLSNYKSTIVFCPSVSTAMRLAQLTTGIPTAFVSGETPSKERKLILEDFLNGTLRVIFNCEVLTTGFDHPGLDCIVLARPTKSLNLYNQMIGRGTRIAPGKTKCTVFDITGTVKHLGKLDEIEVKKIDGKWDVMTAKGRSRNKIMSYYKSKI